MKLDSDMLEQLIFLASSNPLVQVLWLYGSRAKGTAGPSSDWDLAVAFDPVKQSGPLGAALENRLRPELLALTGDEGARAVIGGNRGLLRRIYTADPGVLQDVDRPGDIPP